MKLADFGFACYDGGNSESEKLCGTPIYCAPEMIKGRIQHKALDIWSLGVLLFEMLTGSVPFSGQNHQALFENILNVRINWPKNISPEAKDLISKLLNPVPEHRLNIEEINKHSWFTTILPKKKTIKHAYTLSVSSSTVWIKIISVW